MTDRRMKEVNKDERDGGSRESQDKRKEEHSIERKSLRRMEDDKTENEGSK
jgi:hypothetical protein